MPPRVCPGGSSGDAGGSSAGGYTASGSGGKAHQGALKRKAGRPILCDKDPNSADLTDDQRRILKRCGKAAGALRGILRRVSKGTAGVRLAKLAD